MRKILKVNYYFFIIMVLSVFAPFFLNRIYISMNITDSRLVLLFNHLLIFLVPAIIYILVTKESFKDTLKLNKLQWKDMIILIILGFVVQPVMNFFSVISSLFFTNDVGEYIVSISSTPYFLLLGLVAVLPSITEEVTLRGVVLSGYEAKNKYVAALVTGLFFGIFHLNAQQFLYAVLMGFILALVVRITNSIFASMIIHFIVNGTSVSLVKLLDVLSEGMNIAQETTTTSILDMNIYVIITLITIWLIIALAFGVLVWLCIYYLERNNRKRVDKLQENSLEVNSKSERIINIPFILTILLYIVCMWRILFKN